MEPPSWCVPGHLPHLTTCCWHRRTPGHAYCLLVHCSLSRTPGWLLQSSPQLSSPVLERIETPLWYPSFHQQIWLKWQDAPHYGKSPHQPRWCSRVQHSSWTAHSAGSCATPSLQSARFVWGDMYVAHRIAGASKWLRSTSSWVANIFSRAKIFPGLPDEESRSCETPLKAMHCLAQNSTALAMDFRTSRLCLMLAALRLHATGSRQPLIAFFSTNIFV